MVVMVVGHVYRLNLSGGGLVSAIGDYRGGGDDFSLKVFYDEAVKEAEDVVFFVEVVIHYSSWLAMQYV